MKFVLAFFGFLFLNALGMAVVRSHNQAVQEIGLMSFIALAVLALLWFSRRHIWNGLLNSAALGLRMGRIIGNKSASIASEIDRRAQSGSRSLTK